MQEISLAKFKDVIASKSELYDSVIRNGFYLPKESCNMVTEDYLMGVARGEVHCPKYTDIKLLPCPSPPTLGVLTKEILKIADTNSWITGIED